MFSPSWAGTTTQAGLYPGQGLEEKLQGALPAIAIGVNPAFSSAYANDVAPEMAYAQEVLGYGRPGDVLLGLRLQYM